MGEAQGASGPDIVQAGGFEAVTNAMRVGASDPGLQRAGCESLCTLMSIETSGIPKRAADCECLDAAMCALRGHALFPWVCSAALEAISGILAVGDQRFH